MAAWRFDHERVQCWTRYVHVRLRETLMSERVYTLYRDALERCCTCTSCATFRSASITFFHRARVGAKPGIGQSWSEPSQPSLSLASHLSNVRTLGRSHMHSSFSGVQPALPSGTMAHIRLLKKAFSLLARPSKRRGGSSSNHRGYSY